jgi:hypothetical protein
VRAFSPASLKGNPIMRKFILALLALVTAYAAQAGTVYDRSTNTTAAATGICTITPSASYAGLELKKVWIERAAATNQSFTVYRVIQAGAYTQSVCTVAIAAATTGSGVPTHYAGLKSGEYWLVKSLGGIASSNAVVIIDYEVQTHD